MARDSVLCVLCSVFGVLYSLAACSAPIPPQPTPETSRPAASSAAAKPSAQGRVATVTGTGRFGLSVRKEPGLSAERVATVPDGFQAAVTGGPVGKDGADWYEIKAPDVSGWASGAYLSIAAGQASALPIPPPDLATKPSAGPNAIATPLVGILSQLGRESNYSVNGSGIFVEERLKPAVDHVGASKTAAGLLRKVAPAWVRLTVAHFPATSEGGEFSTLGHSIKIADSILQENLDVQAAVMAHELQHAADILVDHAAPDTAQDCVNLEVRAFRAQETVWLEITKATPPQTRMERELDQLSHVVDSPAFAEQLSKLYANECASYAGSSR